MAHRTSTTSMETATRGESPIPSAGVVNTYRYDAQGRLISTKEGVENMFRARGEAGWMDQGNGLLFTGTQFQFPELRLTLPSVYDPSPPVPDLRPQLSGAGACFFEGVAQLSRCHGKEDPLMLPLLRRLLPLALAIPAVYAQPAPLRLHQPADVQITSEKPVAYVSFPGLPGEPSTFVCSPRTTDPRFSLSLQWLPNPSITSSIRGRAT